MFTKEETDLLDFILDAHHVVHKALKYSKKLKNNINKYRKQAEEYLEDGKKENELLFNLSKSLRKCNQDDSLDKCIKEMHETHAILMSIKKKIDSEKPHNSEEGNSADVESEEEEDSKKDKNSVLYLYYGIDKNNRETVHEDNVNSLAEKVKMVLTPGWKE